MGMSTINPSAVESQTLSWDVGLYSHTDYEQDDSEILTALVRKSYLNHLQKHLFQNYNQWRHCNPNNEDIQYGKAEIVMCANLLEQRALRACMMVSFYQKAMNKIMREIKLSSKEGSLYTPLVDQLYEKKGFKYDKETQTNITLMGSSEPVIELKKVDLFGDNQFKTSVCAQKLSLANKEGNKLICTLGSEIPDKPARASLESDDLEDLITILMSSPNFPPRQDEEKIEKIKCSSPKRRKFESESYSETEMKQECSNETISISNMSSTNIVEEETHKQKLDERLKKMASLFGDLDDDSQSDGVNKQTKNEENVCDVSHIVQNIRPPADWHEEYIVQKKNLKNILTHFSQEERLVLDKSFRDLFGPDNLSSVPYSEFSDNEIAFYRKRTANLVVRELTPYYLSGNIASRILFKIIAKKITDSALLLSPTTEAPMIPGGAKYLLINQSVISQMVKEMFENGKKISSEEDIS